MALGFFQIDEIVSLEKEFKATCWHEAGHASVGIDGLKYVVVKKSKKLNYVDGGAEIPEIPGGHVAQVALAGCMAEAKRYAELNFGGGRFQLDNWDFAIMQIGRIGGQIDPREPYALFHMLFKFKTAENGEQLCWGSVTARDLLNIPPDECNEKHIRDALGRVARFLDQDRTWTWVGNLGQAIEKTPGYVFSKDEILKRWGNPS